MDLDLRYVLNFIYAKLNNKYFHGYNFLSRKHEKLSCIGLNAQK